MLAVVEIDGIPYLEQFRYAIKVLILSATGGFYSQVAYLLLEAVKLDHAVFSRDNLDLVAAGGSTPLRRDNVFVIQGEGVAASRWFPAKALLRKAGESRLLREVQVDAFERFAVSEGQLLVH